MRPTSGCVCIVMVCTATAEADEVSRQLHEFDNTCMVTYRRVEDLVHNVPAGKVAMVILATHDEPPRTMRTLEWLRRRLPTCPLIVVGDAGGSSQELAARQGGACFVTRPVPPDQWRQLLDHALGMLQREFKHS